MKRQELIEFNNAFSKVKVSGLGKEASLKYFKLKITVSEEINKIKEYEKVAKEETKPDDVEDEHKLTTQQFTTWRNAFDGILEEYYNEDLEKSPDTKILSEDELLNNIISNELNQDMTTEEKSVLVKYLLKSSF